MYLSPNLQRIWHAHVGVTAPHTQASKEASSTGKQHPLALTFCELKPLYQTQDSNPSVVPVVLPAFVESLALILGPDAPWS